MQTYDVIIWDWNGTLLDDSWLCLEVMNDTLRKRDMPELSKQRYCEIFGFPVIDYYRRAGFTFEEESFEVVGTEFIDGYEARRHESSLRHEAMLTLQAIQAAEITQCILSAYRQSTLHQLTEHYGVRAFCDHVVGLSNHYAAGKVDEGKDLITKLGIDPDRILMIGDTAHDSHVAEELGIHAMLIPSGNQTTEVLQATGRVILNDLADLRARIGC